MFSGLCEWAAVCTVIRCSNWHVRFMIVYENCWSFFRRFHMRSGMIHELQKMFCLYRSSMISVFMITCRNIIHEMCACGPCRMLWMPAISHVRQTPISPYFEIMVHNSLWGVCTVLTTFPCSIHQPTQPTDWCTSFRLSEKASILVFIYLFIFIHSATNVTLDVPFTSYITTLTYKHY